MEYIVRGKGFIGSGKTEPETIRQIENTVVLTRDGVPIRVRDLAQVQTGPAFRDGALGFQRPGGRGRHGRDALSREPARSDRASRDEDRVAGIGTRRHQDSPASTTARN